MNITITKDNYHLLMFALDQHLLTIEIDGDQLVEVLEGETLEQHEERVKQLIKKLKKVKS